MLWIDGLLLKLRKINIHGHIYNAIKLLTLNRTIQVRIGSTLSDKYIIENGMPQGSILSPLLFLIFINDFPQDTKNNIESSIFADDCAFWKEGRNINHISNILQLHLDKISKWFNKWGLKLNTTKTVEIIFTKRRTLNIPKLKVSNMEINAVSHCKCLGLTFDKYLNLDKHISNLITKTTPIINLIRHLGGQSWGANIKTQLQLYIALIKSKISYGSELFFSAAKQSLKKLDTIQHKSFIAITRAFKGTSLLALQNELGQYLYR